MRALIAVAFLLTVVGFANAQFRPAPPNRPEAVGGMYECAVVGRDADEEGDDPFYKVMIYIETQAFKPSGMTVEHVSASGRRVSRSDQYSLNASFSYEPEKLKITWVGQFKNNPRMKMAGTLIFSERQWRYLEQLSTGGGKPEFVTKSICHQSDPE